VRVKHQREGKLLAFEGQAELVTIKLPGARGIADADERDEGI
jgi:hypothetical protein